MEDRPRLAAGRATPMPPGRRVRQRARRLRDGVIVLGVRLHFLPPLQCAMLVVAFGLITQGYGTWKLRHAFEWRRIAPFVVGGVVGVPVGTAILASSDPRYFRAAVGGRRGNSLPSAAGHVRRDVDGTAPLWNRK